MKLKKKDAKTGMSLKTKKSIMAGAMNKKDIFCMSEGEASVGLAKYGLLAPKSSTSECGQGLRGFLDSLGEKLPAVIDLSATEFLLAASSAKGPDLSELPICAFFPEASRTMEVSKALWSVATGVSTYFWPPLPVTGSEKTLRALSELCKDRFGAELHVVTRRMEARAKAELFLKSIEAPQSLSGKPW